MAEDRRTQLELDEARRSALATGQSLEKRGLLEAAIQAYLSGNASDEAARLLVAMRRFADAGNVLLQGLGVPPDGVGKLDAAGRRHALQAGICLAKGGDTQNAITVFIALGEKERAAELLRRAGDHVRAAQVAGAPMRTTGARTLPPVSAPTHGVSLATAQTLEANGKFDLALEAYVQLRHPGHAARMAERLARPGQAAELYITAGMPAEAAAAFASNGEGARSLAALLRVPRDDPRYRAAAVQAIRLAADLNALDFNLENFLTRFLGDPPQNDRELEAVYALAKLYQKNDFIENAKDAYRRVLSAKPGYRDTAARLQAIEEETKGSSLVYEQILKEDAAFFAGGHARPGAPAGDLPDLPDLPGMPNLPTIAPPRPSAPRPTQPVARSTLDAEAGTVSSVPASWRPATPLSTPPSQPRLPQPTSPLRGQTPPPPAATDAWPAPPTSTRGSAPVAPRPPAPTIAPPAPTLAAGSLLADRYRLLKKIGQGGMAAVFMADDLELGERIAIKVFTKLVEDEQMIARFKQELTLSRQLNHPNIIRLYDIGTLQGHKYITMELLSGDDLKARLGRPIDVPTGVGYLLQACSALQHAHDKGVIHRDIKPANLFLSTEGVVKLMDFGIAKRQATPGLTVAGMIAGTPEYMSPEQISGFDKVTASTDLYALGIMAYEFFTGRVPFRHPEIMPLLVMHMNDVPAPPRTKNPAIPPALEAIILKLLEKEPARRHASCKELAAALQALRTSA